METKNIFIIPTQKSVLGFRNNHYILRLDEPFTKYGNANPQHIYITSDEEIKEGDFRIEEGNNNTFHVYDTPDHQTANWCNQNGCKKIVITSDPILIEHGIQAVPDGFLKGFVNNPKDSYSVRHVLVSPMGREVDPFNITQNHSGCEWIYKVYLPTENPINLVFECSCMRYEAGCFSANCRSCGLPPKQKTAVEPEKLYTYAELRLWLYERDVYLYNYYTTYKNSNIPMITVDKFIKMSHEYLMERKLKK